MPNDAPRRTPSQMRLLVIEHVRAAREALAAGAEPPPAPVPRADPLFLAASTIVYEIRHDRAGETDEALIAWVMGVLREIEQGR